MPLRGLSGQRTTPKAMFARLIDHLHGRLILALTVLFLLGVGIMLWHVSRLQSNLIESMALANGSLYTEALTQFRTLYTREVVERVRHQGIEVVHNYKDKKGAIPLPATLSMELGQKIGRTHSGATTRLYSPYPFPWRRAEGGLQDDFGRNAWTYLKKNPHTPFYRFETIQGRTSLRYATADLMRDSCIDCHNTHPDSPKTDWKTGDVRGVLEIVHPLDEFVAETTSGVRETFGIMTMLALLWWGGVGLVITKLRKTSEELEQRVDERTSDLLIANKQLEAQIAERLRSELALRELSRKTHLVLSSAGEGIYGLDADGNTTFINPAGATMIGWAPDAVIGKPPHAIFHHTNPDGTPYPREACPLHSVFRDGKVHSRETEVFWKKDGTSFPVEYTSTPMRDEDHTLVGAVVTFRDVTVRKRTETVVRESQSRLEGIVTYTTDGIISVDEDERIILFNPAAEEIFACSHADAYGKPVSQFIPERIQPSPQANPRRVSEKGIPSREMGQTGEVIGLKTNGEEFPLEISTSQVLVQGRKIHTVILRDITGRKQAEAMRQKAQRHTEQILASISSILIGLDEQGRVLRWNAAAEKTFGFQTHEVEGHPLSHCGIQWDWSRIDPAISNCLARQEPVRLDDLRYVTVSGKEGFLGLTFSPVLPDGGETAGLLILGVDLSERKMLEAQLGLAQKMESIGQLAAGIAHEINTPIQYVSDNLRFLKEGFTSLQTLLASYALLRDYVVTTTMAPEALQTVQTAEAEADVAYLDDEIPKALQQSLEGADRVARIVRAMKDFSHPGTGEKKAVDLNKAIESTVIVARNEWKYVAEVVTELDAELPLVPCLQGEFNQVVLNLLINAAHAVDDVVQKNNGGKGRITVCTRTLDTQAEIRITDTGTGIPEAVQARIFDPFFTTKEVGRGSGQGLAIAHDVIVKKHGGTLTFETNSGTGTTFVIRLPLTENTPQGSDAQPATSGVKG